MIDATFRIPFDALDGLKDRIAEANKKAARLDVEPLTLTLGETDTVEKFVGGFPTGEVLVFVNGTVSGTTPRRPQPPPDGHLRGQARRRHRQDRGPELPEGLHGSVQAQSCINRAHVPTHR